MFPKIKFEVVPISDDESICKIVRIEERWNMSTRSTVIYTEDFIRNEKGLLSKHDLESMAERYIEVEDRLTELEKWKHRPD